MKSSGILINTARGSIVDQAALYKALKDGVIAGAGIDVTDPEPIDPNDPLLTLRNVVVTPHIGSASTDAIDGMGITAASNIIAILEGKHPISCVNTSDLSWTGQGLVTGMDQGAQNGWAVHVPSRPNKQTVNL